MRRGVRAMFCLAMEAFEGWRNKQGLLSWEPLPIPAAGNWNLHFSNQCLGSGSGLRLVGSVCFWASWIHNSPSRSVSHKYGSSSGSFHHQAKIARKTFISTLLWLLYDFLSLKNDASGPVFWIPRTRMFLGPFRIRTKMSRIRTTASNDHQSNNVRYAMRGQHAYYWCSLCTLILQRKHDTPVFSFICLTYIWYSTLEDSSWLMNWRI